jgi:hypothetical protein
MSNLSGNSFEGFVTAQECLDRLFPTGGLCLRSFRTLQALGRIPHLKLGRRTLFSPEAVRLALEKHHGRGVRA